MQWFHDLQFALFAPLGGVSSPLLYTGLVFLLPKGDRHKGIICLVLSFGFEALGLLYCNKRGCDIICEDWRKKDGRTKQKEI